MGEECASYKDFVESRQEASHDEGVGPTTALVVQRVRKWRDHCHRSHAMLWGGRADTLCEACAAAAIGEALEEWGAQAARGRREHTEALKRIAVYHEDGERLIQQRDEARAGLERVSERYHEIEHREQVARAQVARLLDTMTKLPMGSGEALKLRESVPAEARALLDRLRRLEEHHRNCKDAAEELSRARHKFPRRQSSPHEGYAVILEELDELWESVRAYQPNGDRTAMRKEAIQVAAMALRFVEDICDA